MFTLTVDRVSGLIGRLAMIIGAIFLVLMALHISVDVVLRLVFGSSFPGTLEIVSFYYMACVVFLPLAFVERRGEHIDVDVLVNLLPRRIQLYLFWFSCVLGLLYFGALGYQTLLDAISATRTGQTAMANFTFYIWPARWVLPIGFLAASLAIVSRLLKSLTNRNPHYVAGVE